MSARSRGPKPPHRARAGNFCVRGWWIVVGIGLLVSQLFSLGHLLLFTHTTCEHGALVHTLRIDRQSNVRPHAHDTGLSVTSGGGSEFEHDHCNPFATPPAIASMRPAFNGSSLLEAPLPIGVCASSAVHSVAILAFAPKTSPTA